MDFTTIKTPSDVKKLSDKDLEDFAEFCRGLILHRTSEFGGHVGPDLGVVEVTLAMASEFSFPADKLVWDVSHQDFTWKMITGRMEPFIHPVSWLEAGEYTEPGEAPEYDMFYAGHTSPSITLSLGLAKARDLKGEKYNVIAFIGDASLSGGQALEGLDAAGVFEGNLIIVVNDNQMSIPEVHGGMFENLRELRESNGTASNNFFKTLGLDYRYVAEGNNIGKLRKVFREVRDSNRPVVVHINTQKGEGYVPAERDREAWHAHDPYVIESGASRNDSPGPDMTSVMRDYLMEKLQTRDDILVVTSSTPEMFGFLERERALAGDHYLDLSICEQAAVSVSAAAAKGGVRSIYTVGGTFLQRAYDQLMQDLALDNLPAVIVVCYGGIYGIPDATHLGFWDIPMLASIPNIVYLAPTSFKEYRAMMDWAISQTEHPVAVRPPFGPVVADDALEVDSDYSEINKFKITQEGSRVAIIAEGDFYPLGEKVATLLKERGVTPTLINPRFVSGVDEKMLKNLEANHSLVVTLENGSIAGGFGEMVARFYGLSDMKVMVKGVEKKFVDRYEVNQLMSDNRLLPSQIADDIMQALNA